MLKCLFPEKVYTWLKTCKNSLNGQWEKGKELFLGSIYRTEMGKKLYWKRRGHDLFTTYGHSRGGQETLREVLREVRPRRLFDFGCGNGRNFSLYAELGIEEVIGQDISASAIAYARKRGFSNVSLFLGSLEKYEIPQRHFDIAISNRVMQHLDEESLKKHLEILASLTDRIYINELTRNECEKRDLQQDNLGFYIFLHDYSALMEKHGFFLEKEFLVGDQSRRLYVRRDFPVTPPPKN